MKLEYLLSFIITSLIISAVALAEEQKVCTVYFTGVGCPHCAKADPVLLKEFVLSHKNLVVIEYEIYQQRENAPLLMEYNEKYNTELGVPLLIFNNELSIIGDSPIITGAEQYIETLKENNCPLLNNAVSFDEMDLNSLPGLPKIWANERILIKVGSGSETPETQKLMKELLFSENLKELINTSELLEISPVPVHLSGQDVNFGHAVKIGENWIFQYNSANGNFSQVTKVNSTSTSFPSSASNSPSSKDLTIAKIISLAVVDSVNPCALAVLSLMLIAIITYNPKNKKNILLAGGAFSLSVFIMYLIYGLVIIRFFQIIQALTSIRLTLYKILGGVAIILGILNIKDFFYYKPGGLGTEMPMSLRPKVKRIISGITSPKGAFSVGLFVTVFLLPCTIGPYIVAGGILSAYELLAVLPWLLIYNLIFILPMVAITLLVYGGISTVENVSKWKDKNIRYLHFVAGTIIFLLGLAMLMGWV